MTLLSHSFSLFFFIFIFWNFWTHQVWPHLQAKVSASPSSSDLGTVPMSQVLPHLQAKVSASPSSSGLMGRCPFHSTKFPLLLLLCFGRLLRSPPVNSWSSQSAWSSRSCRSSPVHLHDLPVLWPSGSVSGARHLLILTIFSGHSQPLSRYLFCILCSLCSHVLQFTCCYLFKVIDNGDQSSVSRFGGLRQAHCTPVTWATRPL